MNNSKNISSQSENYDLVFDSSSQDEHEVVKRCDKPIIVNVSGT